MIRVEESLLTRFGGQFNLGRSDLTGQLTTVLTQSGDSSAEPVTLSGLGITLQPVS